MSLGVLRTDISSYYLFFLYLTESKTENNRTECYLGQDNNSLLVYKVESSSAAHEEDTVRKIAIERQGATEVEVQVWKTVDGKAYEHLPLLPAQCTECCKVMGSSHYLPEI